MCKRLIMVLFIITGLWGNAQPVFAQVHHVSINSRQSALDQPPLLKMNLVMQNDDWSSLRFYLRQKVDGVVQQQALTIQPINRFLAQLSGKSKVTDNHAQLVITQNDKKSERILAVLALFEAPLSFNSAALANTQVAAVANTRVVNDEQHAQPSVTSATAVDDTPAKVAVLAPSRPNDCQIVKDNSDTLWRIADRYKDDWNTSVYGAMLAIFETNMLAFSQQKIHLLLKDAVLVCPSTEVLAQYDNKAVDKRVFEVIEAKHAAK
jgi:FimV-like protein